MSSLCYILKTVEKRESLETKEACHYMLNGMGKNEKEKQLPPTPLAYLAEEALKKAVSEAIAEHRRNGVPIAIRRNDKVVSSAADQIEVREPQAKYTISRKGEK